MKSTECVPGRRRPHIFSQSPRYSGGIPHCGLLFQPLCQWVHVTFFVLVHVEVRVGHVCCECAIRRLEKSIMRFVHGVELRAHTSYSVSSPLNSLATNRALIPVFPVVQIPACRHSFLAETCVHIHSLVHSEARPVSWVRLLAWSVPRT